jgi:Ca2+-binding EF-hand superfamily protein
LGGVVGFEVTVDDLQDLTNKIDRRSKGVLDFNDFMEHLVPFLRKQYQKMADVSHRRLETLFKKIDANGDGNLTFG